LKVQFESGTERVACGCRVHRGEDLQGIEFCSAHAMGFNLVTRNHAATVSHQERLSAVRTAYLVADACCNTSDPRTVQLPTDCWRQLAHEIRELVR
jgi:hypothetical protein